MALATGSSRNKSVKPVLASRAVYRSVSRAMMMAPTFALEFIEVLEF
jgi:hypothetical protein